MNQAAVFSAMSSATGSLHEWLGEHPELYRKIVIPPGLKWRIRDHLDQANLTERVLFPGLDGLCRWLGRFYGPRPEQGGPAAPASPAMGDEPGPLLGFPGTPRGGPRGQRDDRQREDSQLWDGKEAGGAQ